MNIPLKQVYPLSSRHREAMAAQSLSAQKMKPQDDACILDDGWTRAPYSAAESVAFPMARCSTLDAASPAPAKWSQAATVRLTINPDDKQVIAYDSF
ncbi:MAG: hypothetical protein ABF868_11240 [Sporolactobacillus sp.]